MAVCQCMNDHSHYDQGPIYSSLIQNLALKVKGLFKKTYSILNLLAPPEFVVLAMTKDQFISLYCTVCYMH